MDIETLKSKAREAARHSYAPYSRFTVAAALETDDGRVFTGVNVENASYGLTICAERNAIFAAVAQGARRINRLVVYTPTATPTPPCGACRQVIAEFTDSAEILCICDSEEVLTGSIKEWLPGSFSLDVNRQI